MARPRKVMTGTRPQNIAAAPHVVVGLTHVVVGAVHVATWMLMVFGSGFTLQAPGPILTAILAGATVLGGLWLADGRRRGAVLSLLVDGTRLATLILLDVPNRSFDLVVNIALAVAVMWVLPRMEVERDAEARER